MSVVVGYDFDEPIYPWYDLAHAASLKAGIALPEHEPTSWNPHTTYGCSLERWVEVLDNEVLDPDGMYRQPFQPGVVELINAQYERGYEIHIITARGQFGKLGEMIKEITREEVAKNGLKHHGLHFVKDKAPLALELGLDYFIDDRPSYYDEMDAAGINVWMLNERWNRPWDDGKRRVHSVAEYVRMIHNIEEINGLFTPPLLA